MRRRGPHTSVEHTHLTTEEQSGPTTAAGGSRRGLLTVGQTARILGVSASTLRLWESVGLVAPVRSHGRYRLYSPELLKVLKRIKYLRDVQRLNVPGIKRELGGVRAPRTAAEPKPLGPTLKRLRTRTGLGILDAAKRAGISAGFLSSIERAQANASVATLQRLAAAYGTTVMDLFQAPKRKDRVVRPHERRVLEMHSGVRMEMLSSGATMLQSMLFRVAPRSGSDGSYSHQGESLFSCSRERSKCGSTSSNASRSRKGTASGSKAHWGTGGSTRARTKRCCSGSIRPRPSEPRIARSARIYTERGTATLGAH